MSKMKSIIALLLIFTFYLSGCSLFNSNSQISTTLDENNTLYEISKKNDENILTNSIGSEKVTFDDSVTLINDNRGVPVLYYHSVRETCENDVTISKDMLKKELQYIKDQGYVTLTISQLNDYLLNNSPIPEKSIVITFDDGYMDNYYNAFPILKELNMTATIFCITAELDGSYYLSEDAINEMSQYGIDIQSHTVNHLHLDTLTYEEQLKELTESKKTLESITGKNVTSIAFPFGDYNKDTIKAAKNSGYTLAFTTNKGLADRNDDPLELDRLYINSSYDMKTFKSILENTDK